MTHFAFMGWAMLAGALYGIFAPDRLKPPESIWVTEEPPWWEPGCD